MLGKVTTIDPCEPGQQTNSSYDLLQVVDHYEKPRNVGSFDKKDIDVEQARGRTCLWRRHEAADTGAPTVLF